MENKNQKTQNNAPINACVFASTSAAEQVMFVEDASAAAGKKDHFKIVGYSGQIIPKHWFWGNLAFDLAGLSFQKSKTPVLQEHFKDKRMGFAEKQEITDKVIVEGKFLDNSNAQEIKKDMLSGFPMEASLYVPPSVVEYITEGASVQVNGQTLFGPGTVFRKAKIKEVSICVFSADSNTTATSLVDKNNSEIEFNIFKADQKQATTEIKTATLATKTIITQKPEPPQKRPIVRMSDEEFWRKLYAVDPAIQMEFSSVDNYVAYKLAESKGKVSIIENRTEKI